MRRHGGTTSIAVPQPSSYMILLSISSSLWGYQFDLRPTYDFLFEGVWSNYGPMLSFQIKIIIELTLENKAKIILCNPL